MKKHFTIIALALIISIGSQAKERTAQQKRKLALSVLKTNMPTRAEEAGSIEELKTMKTLTVMGYADGRGFAVISNDDRHEAVLGWSDGQFNADRIPDGLNGGLTWLTPYLRVAMTTRAPSLRLQLATTHCQKASRVSCLHGGDKATRTTANALTWEEREP